MTWLEEAFSFDNIEENEVVGLGQARKNARQLSLDELEKRFISGEITEIEAKELIHKRIQKLEITEEDLKKQVGCGLTLEKWFDFLYDFQDGYSAMLYININKEYAQRMYATEQMKFHVVISEFINCYASMNSFFYPKRTKNALRKIGFFYVDIDPRSVGITKEEAFKELKRKIKAKEIPKTSAIVDSGGGYYAIFKIEAVYGASKKTQALFNHIESYLVDLLADIGADSNAKDLSRVLRVPGTHNPKYGNNVLVEVVEFNEGLIYCFKDFVDLMNEANGFDLEAYKRLKEARKKAFENGVQYAPNKKELEKAEQNQKAWVNGVRKKFNIGSLQAARSRDFKRLLLMRSFKMNGYRNTILWLYGLTQRHISLSKKELTMKLEEFNQKFTEPLLKKEVVDTAEHVWKKVYYNRNSTIIKKLNITLEEQKNLSTIICKDIKYERNNEKRTPRNENNLTPRQQEALNKFETVQKLKKQGLSRSQVIEKTGYSESTVKRNWKV